MPIPSDPSEASLPTLSFKAGGMTVSHELSETTPLTFTIGNIQVIFMVTTNGTVMLQSSLPFASVTNNMKDGCIMEFFNPDLPTP